MEQMIHVSDLPKPAIRVNISKFNPTQFFDLMTEVRHALVLVNRSDIWIKLAPRLHDAENSTQAQRIILEYVRLL